MDKAIRRHEFYVDLNAFPIILGVSEPVHTPRELYELKAENNKGVTYEGKPYTLYEASQQQRKLERSIRKVKRELIVSEELGDRDSFTAQSIRLRRLTEYYNDFSDKCRLTKRRELMSVGGYGRKISGKAGYASKKASTLGVSNKGKPTGKAEFVKQIDIAEIDSEIKKIEDSIKDLPVENMYAILKSGKIYKSIGNETRVTMEGIDFRNAVITHNHPLIDGCTNSFGEDDINFVKAFPNFKELRAVDSVYKYKLRVIKDMSSLSYSRIYNGGLEEFVLAGAPDDDFQHFTCLWLKKHGYIEYERIHI